MATMAICASSSLLPFARRRETPRHQLLRCFSTHPSSVTHHLSLAEGTLLPSADSTRSNEKNMAVNADIKRFCEMGNLQKAVETILDAESTRLSRAAYCSVLQLCGELEALSEGMRIHSLLSSSDVFIDALFGLKLVFMYVKCKDMENARKVFDEIPKRENSMVWNLMMNGYLEAGDFDKVVAIFQHMLSSEAELNPHVFSCVLKCVSALAMEKMGQSLHGLLVKSGFVGSVAVANALIAFYCRCRIDVALKVFDEMYERDVITWNTMINGCAVRGLLCKGVDIFEKMWASGIGLDSTTLVCVLSIFSKSGNLLMGKAIHGLSIKRGHHDVSLSNSLVNMYSKCGDLHSATVLFKKIEDRDAISWTAMISGGSQAVEFDEPMKLFEKLEADGIEVDSFIITSIFHSCAASSSLEKGVYVHNYIIRKAFEINVYIANALMDMYVKCGNVADARTVFDGMDDRDIASWNTMISGYAKNHLPSEALSLFRSMLVHVKPNSVSMSCVISAVVDLRSLKWGKEIHGHILRAGYSLEGHIANILIDMYAKCGELSQAWQIFDSTAVKDPITWTAMIAGYCMHGNGKAATSLFKKMLRAKIEPNSVSFLAILRSCSQSGLVDEGWRFFDSMRNECCIDPNLDHYLCMVHLLSRAGRLSKAHKFIQAMPIAPDSRIWMALLSGCRKHNNAKMAETIAEQLIALEPDNAKYYVLLTDIYAEIEKQKSQNKLRDKMSGRTLSRNHKNRKFNLVVKGAS